MKAKIFFSVSDNNFSHEKDGHIRDYLWFPAQFEYRIVF